MATPSVERGAPTPRTRRWRRLLTPLALVAFVLGLYTATAQTSGVIVDVYSSSLAGWQIAHTGDPWLDDVDTTRIPGYGDLDDEQVFIGVAPNGHRVSYRLPGVIAAAVPAYWLSGDDGAPESFSLVPEAVTASLIASLTVLMFFLTLRPLTGTSRALAAAIVLAVATPMWSVAGNALYTHTLTTVGIVGMASAAARERWWLVGLLGGVAIWGRLHVAVIVAVLGVGLAIARRRPGIAIKVAVPSAAMLLLTSVWTQWMYGSWIPGLGYNQNPTTLVSGGRNVEMPSAVVNQLGLWLSPDKGILIWTPALLVLAPAVVRAWHEVPDWSRWLAAGAFLYTLLQGQVNLYTGGGAHYGYRLGLEFLAGVAPLFALSAHRAGRVAAVLVWPVIGVQVAAISLGAIFEGPAPEDSYGWRDNAFLVALRTEPLVGVPSVLTVLLVLGVAQMWRELDRRSTAAALAQKDYP